jgi:hypothetical protein
MGYFCRVLVEEQRRIIIFDLSDSRVLNVPV